MGKKTPMPLDSKKEYVYIFLHSAGVVLRFHCMNSRHIWYGKNLDMILSKGVAAIAKHSGSSDWIYFPRTNRAHNLIRFDCTFSNQNQHVANVYFDGVTKRSIPVLPDSFENNVSTLSLMRNCDIPAPTSVRIITGEDSYRITPTCIRSKGNLRYLSESVLDKMLEEMCSLTGH